MMSLQPRIIGSARPEGNDLGGNGSPAASMLARRDRMAAYHSSISMQEG